MSLSFIFLVLAAIVTVFLIVVYVFDPFKWKYSKLEQPDQRLLQIAEKVLRKIGIKPGQELLDFGCGSGTYSVSAAKILAPTGKVYAVDKDHGQLNELWQKVESYYLQNIEPIATAGELKMKFPDASMDVVLLYDIFNKYNFPTLDQRKALLDEIRRVLKQNGFLSVWPTHIELLEAKKEIEQAGFVLQKGYPKQVKLVHKGKNIVPGEILNFRKAETIGKD